MVQKTEYIANTKMNSQITVADLISPNNKASDNDVANHVSLESDDDFEDKEYDESDEEELKLTTPSQWTDVTLIVEEKKIYSSRAILSFASPVWKAVLSKEIQEGDSGSQKQSEINFPDKLHSDVHELILCITPGINKLISSKCIIVLLDHLTHLY